MSQTMLVSTPTRVAASVHKPTTLVELLIRLVDELEAARDGKLTRHNHSALAQWGDDTDFYLEAALPKSAGLEADLCVQAGRVFIRVSR